VVAKAISVRVGDVELLIEPSSATWPQPPSVPPGRLTALDGLVPRPAGEFVGRYRERAGWAAELVSSGVAGIVVHGIGGVGKTMLAAKVVERVRRLEPAPAIIAISSEVTADGLLAAFAAAVSPRLHAAGLAGGTGFAERTEQALEAAARVDLPWAGRLAGLREHVLAWVPVLVVLDNFEDNLSVGGTGWSIRDPLLAALLADLAGSPGQSRLLVTSRYTFTLPGSAERNLAFRPLGPLSREEASRLAWSLPALGRLRERQIAEAWRLTGGHPRALEYLDAVLSQRPVRYPDVTSQLADAIEARTGEPDPLARLDRPSGLTAAHAESVPVAAAAVLLDELLARLGPDAERLLVGISAYRRPVDRNALLFQIGRRDWAAAYTPDRHGAARRIRDLIGAAGLTIAGPIHLDALPAGLRARLEPQLAGLRQVPAPPYQAPAGLAGLVAACEEAGLLAVGPPGQPAAVFVHRWTANEIHRRLIVGQRGDDVTAAHRRAAEYWRWRVAAWPQDARDNINDLLEVRYHLLEAGDAGPAAAVTRGVCAQLHALGALDHEAALILDTLARLPGRSSRRAAWICELGKIAQMRGDYPEAGHRFREALEAFERLGDVSGMARSCDGLGVVAQAGGDYAEAERHYQRSLDLRQLLGPVGGVTGDECQSGAPVPVPALASASGPGKVQASDRGHAGGAARARVPGRWLWSRLPIAAVAVVLAVVSAARLTSIASSEEARAAVPDGRRGSALATAAVMRGQAAAWVAHQVGDGAIVSCDLVMCSALRTEGIAGGSLLVLRPAAVDPLGSDVVVATVSVRSQFGSRLARVYAPEVLASFGSGGARIEIRAVAPDGAAAYLASLGPDLAARRAAGNRLLRDPRVRVPAAARRELGAGSIDSRLLITLAALAAAQPVSVVAFDGPPPGASAGAALRAADVTAPGDTASSTVGLRAILSLLRAQRPPYLPSAMAVTRRAGGQPVVRIEFAAPSPVGLLAAPGGSR